MVEVNSLAHRFLKNGGKMRLAFVRLFLLISVLLELEAVADTGCFIIQEKEHILKQEGDCTSGHSPCSTFKIPISLMGFDSGILIDQAHPEWLFKPGYVDWVERWLQPHNPTHWIKNSCVWYSQVITKTLGQAKFKSYITKFNYGNQDISGDKNKDNGLTNCWLSSSLQISGFEQIAFLQKFIAGSLPVSPKSHQMTKNILFIEELPNGWTLYGKRAGGYLLNNNGSHNRDRQIGWFIGWIEKGDRKIIFAHYIEDTQRMDSPAGKRAQEVARKKLLEIINNEKVE